jgi:hypothetical protein
LDKFPEAFRRFEQVVDTDKFRTYQQLKLTFESWAGRNWQDTYRQNEALKVEARKHGIPIRVEGRPSVASRGAAHAPERAAVTWRHETVTVKGSSQDRYRDLNTGRFIRKPRR